MQYDKEMACRDGRLAWVAEYHMPDEIIARAKQVECEWGALTL